MTGRAAPADPFVGRPHGHRGRLVGWEGHELVELESPALKVVISLSRGAEILELQAKRVDLDVLWHGHPDVVRNVGGVPTVNRPLGNFLDEFAGGWQEILPNAQFAVDYRGAQLGQHGEAALLPWRYELVVDRADELAVRFVVELRRTPLRLTRLMTLRGARLRLDETVENLGPVPIEVQWGHHIALGGPLLAAGARLRLPGGSPMAAVADDSPTNRFAPTPAHWPVATGRDQQPVDASVLPADDQHEGTLIVGPMAEGFAVLENAELPLRVRFDWDVTVFRYCWLWIVLGGLLDWPLWGRHRLVSIEPFTSPLTPLTSAVESGDALSLAAGATVSSWVGVELDPEDTVELDPEDDGSLR